jgi:magnesium transporter
MKFLTVITTIFIPLSFITGLYGMNFDTAASPFNMPELEWKYGYFYSLGLMAIIATGLSIYFIKKKWISSSGGLRVNRKSMFRGN